MKLHPVTITVEPDEINEILNAYDRVRYALLFSFTDLPPGKTTAGNIWSLDNHIASLRKGLLDQALIDPPPCENNS